MRTSPELERLNSPTSNGLRQNGPNPPISEAEGLEHNYPKHQSPLFLLL